MGAGPLNSPKNSHVEIAEALSEDCILNQVKVCSSEDLICAVGLGFTNCPQLDVTVPGC